jgi:glycosyltransferase involved in cell wall biosynthesis
MLLIPPQDYLRHPHLTRLHYIFENFDDSFRVTVLNTRIRAGPKVRESRHEVVETGSASGNMLLSYLWSYRDFHLQLVSLMKRRRYDCVVLSHILSPLVPLLVSGRGLVFDYKDVYSHSASAPFGFPVKTFVYWIARFFEEVLFKWPMTIVAPTPSMQDLLRNRFGLESVLITNGANTDFFRPLSESERISVRHELGIHQDDFCISYLGSIENWLDLEAVIHALEQIDQTKLILIGGSVRSSEYLRHILSMSRERGLKSRVIATGFKSQQEAARIVAASDAAIVPFKTDTELSLVALPDKLFEYLATGIPVISTRLPDVIKMFSDVVHFYGDVDELLGTVRKLMIERANGRPHQQRRSVMKDYDWKLIARKYQQLLGSVIKNRLASQKSRQLSKF